MSTRLVQLGSIALALALSAGCASQISETRETGNPNSVANREDPGPRKTTAEQYFQELSEAESVDPDSADNKDAAPMDAADPATHDAELRAAEAETPDSIDDRQPTPVAIRCVEPRVCELLQQMEPELARSVAAADSLSAAAMADER